MFRRTILLSVMAWMLVTSLAPASAASWKHQPGDLNVVVNACDDVTYVGEGFTPGAFVWINEWTGDGEAEATVGPGVTVAPDGTFAISWNPLYSRCNQQSGTERTGKALTIVERGGSGRMVTVEIDRTTFVLP